MSSPREVVTLRKEGHDLYQTSNPTTITQLISQGWARDSTVPASDKPTDEASDKPSSTIDDPAADSTSVIPDPAPDLTDDKTTDENADAGSAKHKERNRA